MDTGYWQEHPYVSVGILTCPKVNFLLNGYFTTGGKNIQGEQVAVCNNGQVEWKGYKAKEIVFTPQGEKDTFTLQNVVIGIAYHWQRKQNQTFKGALKLLADGEQIIAINIVHIEDYLESVISSEMRATASLEFLKASAIISRSWLLTQIEHRKQEHNNNNTESKKVNTKEEIITWNDRQDHTLFDVCADDHCQRYQGITMVSNNNILSAVQQTRGEVLISEGEICDARFAKCCGGVSEEYSYCWEDKKLPYLSAVRDILPDEQTMPDLTKEDEAEKWIRGNVPSFCNTKDKEILSQVLNDYDLETKDFYRWKEIFTQQELSLLIHKNTGEDFGEILDLIPIARGKSGRIWKLRIVGTKKQQILGKELEIRRILSTTHLYSSAFIVEKGISKNDVPQTFSLLGAGWGHGAGMCQIGAAVMGAKGYSFEQILLHYYQGAQITKLY